MLTFYNKYRQDIYSQNGEDGILAEIIKRVFTENPCGTCVEFGAGDGRKDSNTARLIEQDWTGVLIEANTDLYTQCKAAWSNRKNVMVMASEVKPENVNMQVPSFTDILSIDIDGNDYHVWKALKHRPSVVIIEINSSLHPLEDHISLEKGANFSAMVKLGTEKDYSLLCHTGNLIFLSNDIIREGKYFGEICGPISPFDKTQLSSVKNPLEHVEEYFNTKWYPPELPRTWENKKHDLDYPPYLHSKIQESISPYFPNEVADFLLPGKKPMIGIVCTNNKTDSDSLIASLDKFCRGTEKKIFKLTSSFFGDMPGNTILIPIPANRHYSFAEIMVKSAHYFHGVDYLYVFNPEMVIEKEILDEVIQPFVAVKNPEGNKWSLDQYSNFFVSPKPQNTFVTDAFFGGTIDKVMEALKVISEKENSEIHSETFVDKLNWFVANYENQMPITILDPGYCYPEKAEHAQMPYNRKIIQRTI